MRIGYNTNGFAHHTLLDAIDLMAQLGYTSVALTLDHGALDPFSTELPHQLQQVRERLDRYKMTSVVETGARYLLDPAVKHEPTFVSRDEAARARRLDFICRAVDIAGELKSDCVSLWSGIVRDQVSESVAWTRLVSGLSQVLDYANRCRVTIGFEPEPGMFIDTMTRYEELVNRLPHARLQLTLDVGHLHCLGEIPIEDHIRRWSSRLVNVHLEDMRRGIHEHLMFGEGEIDFEPVFSAFRHVGYQNGLHVELSRHSHEAPVAAARAMEFLRPLATPD